MTWTMEKAAEKMQRARQRPGTRSLPKVREPDGEGKEIGSVWAPILEGVL